MKKIFSFVAIAALVFGMASCKKNGGNTPEPQPGPDTTVIPTADTIALSFNFTEDVYWNNQVEAQGWWQVYAQEERDGKKYFVTLSNNFTEELEGEYTVSDLDANYSFLRIVEGTDTAYVDLIDGSCTVVEAENGDITVEGSFVGEGEGEQVYTLDLHFEYALPTVQETVEVTIADGEFDDSLASYGLYGVMGTDENDIYVQLFIWADEETNTFEGEYTEDDLYANYSGIMVGEDVISIYSAEITVTANEDGSYTIVAALLGENSTLYNVTMTAAPAEEEEGGEEGAPARRIARKVVKSAKSLRK